MSLTALAFLMAFAGGLILALFVRPMFGLLTYIAVFYLHPPSRWWGYDLPELRWSLIAAAVTLVAILLHGSGSKSRVVDPTAGSTREVSVIAMCLLLYSVWMWMQVPWVLSPMQLDGTVLFSKYVLLVFLIIALLKDEKDFVRFCIAHVIGCAYLGWLVYLAPDSGRLEGVGGPGIDDANSLGMHLATGLFFASFLALALSGWKRWAAIGSIPLILNGIIQTETRGAIVGILLGGLITVYLKPRKYRRQFYAFAVMGLLSVVALANEAFLERMDTLRAGVDETSEWDNSAMSRFAIAGAQFEMFADYPFGVGHQGTAVLSAQYLDSKWLAADSGDRASHNTIMSILVDQGIPGILIFIVLALSVIRMLRRMKKWDDFHCPDRLGLYRAMLGGAIVATAGAGMFAQNLKAEVQIWVLALIAVLWNFERLVPRGTSTSR